MTPDGEGAIRDVEFGGHRIEFDDRVLEPRPWTLLQSSWAAHLAEEVPPGPMLELCAGVGQIGLVAAVLSERDLVAVDVDPVACGYARRNAERAGWAVRTQVRCASLEDAVGPDERFPIVLADPPYVPTHAVDHHPDDPTTAIDGGPDGLRLVRSCLDTAARALTDEGVVLLQLWGTGQLDDLEHLPAGLGVTEVREYDERRAVALLRRVNQGARG